MVQIQSWSDKASIAINGLLSLSVLLKKLDFCVKSFVFQITFYDNFDPTAASKHGLAMEYMQNKNTSRCNQKFLGDWN